MKKRYSPIFTVLSMVILTLLAKASGMLRQMAMASVFAASEEGIAFSAASRIPLALFDMLFATAIVGSFLPIYRGRLLSDEKKAEGFSSAFFTFTGLITAVFSLLGMLFARPLLEFTATGLDEKTLSLAAELLRILFPAVMLAGLTYTLIGVLQSHEKFLLPAAVSLFSNGAMLLYLLFCPMMGDQTAAVYGLAYVYLFSWLIQLMTLMLPLLGMKKMPRLTLHLKNEDLLLAEKRALSVMLGAWLLPMMTLVANAFSSHIDMEGAKGAAIVVYENAFSVFSIAGGLVTYGICNYLFPKLTAKFAKKDENGFRFASETGLFALFMITLPLSAFLFLTSGEIVRFLFLHGDFTEALASAAETSLRTLAAALPAYSMVEFFTRVFYASEKTRLPLFSSLIGIGAGLLMALVFSLANVLTVSHAALSTVTALWAAALAELFFARRLFGRSFTKENAIRLLFLLTATPASALIMALISRFLKKIMEKSGAFENFVTIALVFLAGLMVYLIWIIFFRKYIVPNPHEKEDSL